MNWNRCSLHWPHHFIRKKCEEQNVLEQRRLFFLVLVAIRDEQRFEMWRNFRNFCGQKYLSNARWKVLASSCTFTTSRDYFLPKLGKVEYFRIYLWTFFEFHLWILFDLVEWIFFDSNFFHLRICFDLNAFFIWYWNCKYMERDYHC